MQTHSQPSHSAGCIAPVDIRRRLADQYQQELTRRQQDPRLTPRLPPCPQLQRDPHVATALQHVLDSAYQTLAARSMHATLQRIAGGLATLPFQSPEVRALRNDVVRCLEHVSQGTAS